jgi:hypothetical protein
MSARNKLNSAYLTVAGLIGLVAAVIFSSLTVGIVVFVIALASGLFQGNYRAGGSGGGHHHHYRGPRRF